MNKRTIVSVEIPADMVEDIKQMQVVLPISKSDIIRLALRHYLKHKRGDMDEPHDRAFVWNLLCCIWEQNYSERK